MFLIRECSELSQSMWQKIYVLEKKNLKIAESEKF